MVEAPQKPCQYCYGQGAILESSALLGGYMPVVCERCEGNGKEPED